MLDMSKLVWSVLTSVKQRDPLASEVTICAFFIVLFVCNFDLFRDSFMFYLPLYFTFYFFGLLSRGQGLLDTLPNI